jgi:rubrerythrin
MISNPRHAEERPEPCPVCGWAATRLPNQPCPGCGLKYRTEAYVLDGELERRGDFIVIGLLWGAAILVAGALGGAWMTGPLGVMMTLHLGHRALRGTGLDRLVISDEGVGLVRNARVTRFTRWHLFEDARLEPRTDVPGRWRLTIVNAYKPTISTYLHSRGTDADIFANSVEFNFDAPESEARALQERLRERIHVASEAYSPLTLAEMDRVPPDRARLLSLQRCPQCGHDVSTAQDRQCPQCARPFDPSMFALDGRIVTGLPWLLILAVILAFFSMWFAVVKLSAMAITFAIGAVAAVILWWLPRRPRTIVATSEGIEQWPQSGPPRVYPWSELRTCRAIQLESGSWRLALWSEPKTRAWYSPALFMWMTSPLGAPAVDVVLAGDDRAGAVVCEEIERRKLRAETWLSAVS